MSKDEVHEVILGVALVALVYAVLKHQKQVGNGTGMNNVLNYDRSPLSGRDPTRPAQGQSYDPVSPAAFTTLSDLLRGSVHDITTNDTSATNIPMVGDVVSQAVTDYTNPGGVGPQDSVIRIPGAYW